MSRISWNGQLPDGRLVLVVGGWDKPVWGYHFGVYRRSGRDDEEEVVYDNVGHPDLPGMGFPDSMDPFRKVAERLGLAPPERFWERCSEKLGNHEERIE